jgi:hypothetical protein
MAYIRASGHNVPLVLQIAEDGHARVNAHVLHPRFGLHHSSIYIEEEVMSKSGEIDRSILQFRYLDNDGHHWVLPPGRYRAFGLTATLMAASTDLLSQPSDMLSVQPPILHSMKLEFPDGLVHLSSDSSKGGYSFASSQLPLLTPPSAIPSVVSTQNPSSLLLSHLVIPTYLASHSIQILNSVLVSCNALDTWPQSLDPGMN